MNTPLDSFFDMMEEFNPEQLSMFGGRDAWIEVVMMRDMLERFGYTKEIISQKARGIEPKSVMDKVGKGGDW